MLIGLAAVVASPSAWAEDAPLRKINERQDAALRDFAASVIAAGPNVELVADLKAPKTMYTVRIVPAEYENINQRFKAWGETDEAGEAALGSIAHPFVTSWDAKPGCGTWEVDAAVGVWSHPDGEAPAGCPHEQGTSHPGTVTVAGTYAISVFLSTHEPTDSLMAATWSFTCTYTGSESGTERCEETLTDWKGRYGTNQTGPQNQPTRTKAIVAGAVVAAGAAAYVFRKKIVRGIRPVVMRDPK